MWHDNESEIDLLGFDTLVDTLVLLVQQEDLLPLTIGVFSDWGGGKSSLMVQTRNHLIAEKKDGHDRYICLTFNPWQHEDYDDVKAALMTAVMGALVSHQSFIHKVGTGATSKAKTLATKLLKRVNWFRTIGFAAKGLMAVYGMAQGQPTGIAFGVSSVNDMMDFAKTVGEVGDELLDKDAKDDSSEKKEPIEQSIGEFRRDFESLLGELDVDGLVVFIDDLDRCLPNVVIDTLEAIRLFLAVRKTVFVIGADETIVRDAIATRYPELARQSEDIGRKYLEKIIQIPIRVPPLTTPEIETYLNLLGCQKYLPKDDATKLVHAAAVNRMARALDVAMNEGIAQTEIGSLPPDLSTYLQIVARIAPTLCGGLDGNPRQTKRFMNTLLMRRSLARGRGVELDPAVLAKLMILEYFHEPQYRQLFALQQQGNGYALLLEELEAQIGSQDPKPDTSDPEATKEWWSKPDLRAWVALEPPLAGIDLGPYFYFSRDKALAKVVPARRLSQPLQELLGLLQSASDTERAKGVVAAVALEIQDFNEVYNALLSRFVRDPRTIDAKLGPTIVNIAARRPEAVLALATALRTAPVQRIQSALPLQIKSSFKGQLAAELQDLLERWVKQTEAPALQQSAREALAGPKVHGQNKR